MARDTNIGWCDDTVNPSSGCEGCELFNGNDIRDCYASKLHEDRLAKSLPILYDPDFRNVRLIPGRMAKAASWSDLRGQVRPNKPWLNGLPRMIFVGDMGDFCSKQIPTDYIKREILDTISSKNGQRHFWLLLTKQIRRLAEISKEVGGLPDNCMAMTTVTDQYYADKRVPDLIRVEAKWRGISAEPLFSEVILQGNGQPGRPNALCSRSYLRNTVTGEQWVHWVIAGGISGNGVRQKYMDKMWARSLRKQCESTHTPFFFKQESGWKPGTNPYLDGVQWHQMPQVNQYPVTIKLGEAK